jgi:hypothetical protein
MAKIPPPETQPTATHPGIEPLGSRMRRRECPFEDVQVDSVVLRVLRGRGESKVDEYLDALACTSRVGRGARGAVRDG